MCACGWLWLIRALPFYVRRCRWNTVCTCVRCGVSEHVFQFTSHTRVQGSWVRTSPTWSSRTRPAARCRATSTRRSCSSRHGALWDVCACVYVRVCVCSRARACLCVCVRAFVSFICSGFSFRVVCARLCCVHRWAHVRPRDRCNDTLVRFPAGTRVRTLRSSPMRRRGLRTPHARRCMRGRALWRRTRPFSLLRGVDLCYKHYFVFCTFVLFCLIYLFLCVLRSFVHASRSYAGLTCVTSIFVFVFVFEQLFRFVLCG